MNDDHFRRHLLPAPCLIRQATAADAAAIEALYRELVADPLICVLPGQIAAMADSSASFLFVAETKGAVCATGLLTICTDAMYRAQPFGVVENIVVSQAQRGQGVGALLMAHIERTAVEQHCTKLMLMSSSSRTEAHAFFRRCGFNGDAKHAFVKYRRQFAINEEKSSSWNELPAPQ